MGGIGDQEQQTAVRPAVRARTGDRTLPPRSGAPSDGSTRTPLKNDMDGGRSLGVSPYFAAARTKSSRPAGDGPSGLPDPYRDSLAARVVVPQMLS